MRRLILILATMVVLAGAAAPAVLAADPGTRDTSRVLLAFNTDVTVAPGQQLDAVMVTGGTATIQGSVRSLVVLDATAKLQGAHIESVFVAGGTMTADATTVVTGDVRTVGSTVTIDPAATIGGSVTNAERDLATAAAFLVPAIGLFVLGLVLVTFVAGLALAALAARQVRSAEGLISHEPGKTLLFGIGGLVLFPLAAIAAFVTIVGAPLGLALLLMVWPAVAFVGYLVAGIWIGDWLLTRDPARAPAERPYLASFIGLLVLQLASLLPFVGAIASLFGFGAVLLLAWRTFEGPARVTAVPAPPASQPMGV